uniref:Uncharacterized protein n=1 Tax=Aegilops tauschii subsp. strangulata TaxID=200361 RepID=A0A453H571_AEGTS
PPINLVRARPPANPPSHHPNSRPKSPLLAPSAPRLPDGDAAAVLLRRAPGAGAQRRQGLRPRLRGAAALPLRPLLRPRRPRLRRHLRRALRRRRHPFRRLLLQGPADLSPSGGRRRGRVCCHLRHPPPPPLQILVHREVRAETRLSDWVAHNNAIFDVCWIKEGSQLLTASGDQTVKIWSVENKKCLGVLSGHTGSVKSLSCHSSNPDLIVSGSRDGSFALWDLRCDPKTPNGHGEACLMSSAVVKEAHSPTRRNRTRSRAKGASTSITSVLYLKDDISIATSGAADNVVKFWDTRNLKAPISNKTSQSTAQPSEGVTHGISCLSQDSYGAYIAASCMDHRIYLYSTLHMDKGPIKTYTGSKIESFFVKSAISPDGTHILGGSSNGNVYLWQ